MINKCRECEYCKFIHGTERGVMDCDPDEYYCKFDYDEFYEEEWEEECPKFVEFEEPEEDGDRWYDYMRDEGLL